TLQVHTSGAMGGRPARQVVSLSRSETRTGFVPEPAPIARHPMPGEAHRGSPFVSPTTDLIANMDISWTPGPLRSSEQRTAGSQRPVFIDAEEGNRTPKGVSPGDFESPASASSATSAQERSQELMATGEAGASVESAEMSVFCPRSSDCT